MNSPENAKAASESIDGLQDRLDDYDVDAAALYDEELAEAEERLNELHSDGCNRSPHSERPADPGSVADKTQGSEGTVG